MVKQFAYALEEIDVATLYICIVYHQYFNEMHSSHSMASTKPKTSKHKTVGQI